MIDIQEHFVPEKVAEVRKWKILRLAQRLLPAPSDGGRPQHQMCSRLLHLLVLRLSQHDETSPRGPQIETFVNGFQNLDFSLFLF